MSSQAYQSYLLYKSVDIYFIFSFVLDFVEPYEKIVEHLEKLGWQQGRPPDRRGRPPFLHIKRKIKSSESPKYLSTSISSLLLPPGTFKLYYNENVQHSDEKDGHSDEFNVGMEAWGRLFDNGAGCITFKVTLENDVNFRRIYEAHSLNQRMYKKEDSFSRLMWNGEKTDLFNIFLKLIDKVLSNLNKIQEHVVLQDKEIMDLDADDIESQNPYVLSVIERHVSEKEKQICEMKSSSEPECKELAAILFRLVYPYDFFQDLKNQITNVRIPSELISKNGNIRNYAWDARNLMWFSKTSSLFACTDKERIPAVLIKNSLLDTLEIIRTRWHMSILINAQLDLDLENFRPEASEKNLEILENLNKRRKRFASYLHDPLPYNFEGGSVSEISRVASEGMQLAELRNMTIDKFETLDKLHSDLMKLIELRRINSLLSKAKEAEEAS